MNKVLHSYKMLMINATFLIGSLSVFFLYFLDSELPTFSDTDIWEYYRAFSDIREFLVNINYFSIFVPFSFAISSIGFGLQFGREWHFGIAPQIIQRWGLKKYAFVYTASAAFSGGFIFSFGLLLFILYMRSHIYLMNSAAFAHYGWGYEYTIGQGQSFGYLLIILTLNFITGAFAAVISLCISTLTKNKYIIMVSPYIIFKIYSEIAQAIYLPNTWRIDFYFLGRLGIGTSYPSTFLLMLLILIFIIAVGQFFFKKGVRRNLIYEKY